MTSQERRRRLAAMHPGELRRVLTNIARLHPELVDAHLPEASVQVHVPGQIELPC